MAVSDYVVAAICGCFKRESGVNPGIWESLIVPADTFYHVYQGDGIGGYGFGQFTNTQETGGIAWRCRDYYQWCVANNKDPGDGSAEMDYILNVEKVWFNAREQRGSYRNIDQFIASTSTNLADLVWDWLASWEGVPGDAYQERYTFAQKALTYITQHKDDNHENYKWITGNFWMAESQMLNNVMCMYFYFKGYSPGSGSQGDVQGFVNWCIAKCNDPNVGYSQAHRNEETIDGKTYYDCSSFVFFGLKHNGYDMDAIGNPEYAFDTTAMLRDLPKMGFTQVDRTAELLPGDIGLRATHTEVVYEGGIGQARFMGAHSDSLPFADQVSINNYITSGTDYASIWRLTASPTPEPPNPDPSGKGGKGMPLWMMLKRLPA